MRGAYLLWNVGNIAILRPYFVYLFYYDFCDEVNRSEQMENINSNIISMVNRISFIAGDWSLRINC